MRPPNTIMINANDMMKNRGRPEKDFNKNNK